MVRQRATTNTAPRIVASHGGIQVAAFAGRASLNRKGERALNPRFGRQLQISGKNLGTLARPDCCPRCFWLQHTTDKGLPYQIFPGIFSSIDAYTKNVVHGWFDRHGDGPSVVTVNGCTYGGSLIRHDVVAAPGLFLEFGNRVSTTRIREVRVARWNGEDAPPRLPC